METATQKATYLPTVLIIDDEKGFTDYWRKKFHDETSVGVIIANTLEEGRRLVAEHDLSIDGIVSDLFFDVGRDDPDHELFDGIDFLEYSQHERPQARKYVISFYGEDPHYRKRVADRGLQVQHWFQKEWHEPDVQSMPPWLQIERDLMKVRLASEDSSVDLDEHSQHAQRLAPLPMRTYVQHLGRRVPVEHMVNLESLGPRAVFHVKRPIEVICRRDTDGEVHASAHQLGLLEEGHGQNVEEALADIQAIIADHMDLFLGEPDENVIGYARRVKERLYEYLQVEQDRARSAK